MQILIILCVVFSVNYVRSLELSVDGSPCTPNDNPANEIADDYYHSYKIAGDYRDMRGLIGMDVPTVLGWSLNRQASHGDFVTRSMSAECASTYIEFAETALKSLRKSIKEQNSWHNEGAVCNVAYMIVTLPDGNLRNKLYKAMTHMNTITRADSVDPLETLLG